MDTWQWIAPRHVEHEFQVPSTRAVLCMEFLFSQLFALCLLFENQLFHMQIPILMCFPSLTFFRTSSFRGMFIWIHLFLLCLGKWSLESRNLEWSKQGKICILFYPQSSGQIFTSPFPIHLYNLVIICGLDWKWSYTYVKQETRSPRWFLFPRSGSPVSKRKREFSFNLRHTK